MTDRRHDDLPPASIPAQTVERLRASIDKLYGRYSMWTAFRNGLLAGLGATVGVAIILSLLIWTLNLLDFIPGIDKILRGLETIAPEQAVETLQKK